MSLEDVADGYVSTKTLARIEQDDAVPSPSLLAHVAERMGVPVTVFAPDGANPADAVQTYRQAKNLLGRERFAEAAKRLESLLVLPGLPHHLREENVFEDLGDCYERLQADARAVSCYEQAAEAALAHDDIPLVIRAYHKAAQVYKRRDETGLARLYWLRARETLLRHPGIAVPLLCKVEMHLGRIELSAGRYGSALTYYEAAYAHSDLGASTGDRALICHGLAYALAAHGRYEEAARFTDEAVEHYRAIHHTRGLSQCRVNQGVLLRLQGRCEEAVQHFTACLDEGDVANDAIRAANLLAERGWCRLLTGDAEGALADGAESLRRARNHPRAVSFAHLVCAHANLARGRTDEAIRHAEAGLAACERGKDCDGPRIALQKVRQRAWVAGGRTADALAAAVASAREVLDRGAVSLIGPEA